jgi:uncharacterized delta-60 repeat protein
METTMHDQPRQRCSVAQEPFRRAGTWMKKSVARVLTHAVAGLTLLLPTAPGFAQAGHFDPAFGNGGRLVVDVSVESKDDRPSRLIVRANGKLLMGGTCQYLDGFELEAHTFCVTQLRPDGTYDGTFGPAGVGYVQFNTFAGWPRDSYVADMIVLRDGRIALLGQDQDGNQPLLGVLLGDGTALDSTVGGGKGFIEFPLSALAGTQSPVTLAQQPDGKVLVAGAAPGVSGNRDFAITRLLANFSGPDTSFGSNGSQTVAFDLGGPSGDDSDYCSAVRLQSDGRIVLTGVAITSLAGQPISGAEIAITRLNSNGTRDFGFGSNGDGRVHYSAGGEALAVDAEIDGADRIVVGGEWVTAFPATEAKWLVDRLSADGGRDPTFNQGNPKIFSAPLNNGGGSVRRLALTKDGIYAIGDTLRAPPPANDSFFSVARLHPNGSLDQRFGDAGQFYGSFTSTNDVDVTGTDIAIGNGGVMIAGTQTQSVAQGNTFKFAVARLQDVPPVDLIGHKGGEACWSKAMTEPAFLGLVGSNVEGNTACIPPFPVTWFNGTTFGSYTMCYTAACPGGTLGCPIKTHTSAFGAGDSFEGGAFSATGTADNVAMPGVGATGTCNVTASAITTSYLTDYVFTDDGNHGDYAALLNQFTAAPTNVVLGPSGGSDPNCGVAVSYMYPYFYGAAITAMSSGLKQKLENPTVGQSVCPATP